MKRISDRFVPHQGPEDADLFFLGDFPGVTEDTCLQPIAGNARDILESELETIGYTIDQVRIGNVLNYHPHKYKIQNGHETWQYEESKNYLSEYLRTANHKIIIPLGDTALDFLTGFNGISVRRGSVYKRNSSYVIPTVHPSVLTRDGASRPVFRIDLQKVKRVLQEGHVEPDFNFYVEPDIFTLEGMLPVLKSAKLLATDIETKKHTTYIRCIGFAWSNKDAVCIFNDKPYDEQASDNCGPQFRRVVQALLESDAEKVFHNGMFDTIILEANGFEVKNFTYDTMIAQHVLQPELHLGLDFCTSVYSPLNYYKNDGKEASDKIDRKKLGTYNCKDVVATMYTREGQLAEFQEYPEKYEYFKYKMSQLALAKHFSLTGMLVDPERQKALEEVITKKRDHDYMIFVGVQQLSGLKPEELFKVSQSARVKDFLYGTLELPPKKNGEGDITADEDAIVSLIGTVEKKVQDLKTEKARQPWEIKLAALKLILRIRGYDKLLGSYINIALSPDGRARSWYKFWGTETGRWSAAMWHDGTGLNGQTIPRESL